MRFLNKHANLLPLQDEVFIIQKEVNDAVNKYGADKVYNGTIGTLFNEEGTFVAFNSVYSIYNSLMNTEKAKYAANIEGNQSFLDSITHWLFSSVDFRLSYKPIATIGGTGALSLSISTFLDENDILIIPEISWNNYRLISKTRGLELDTYELFDDNKFNLASFKKVSEKALNKKGKVAIIINDPLHNPTGYSLSLDEWSKVIDILNELSQLGEIILINDIAYIDYAKDPLLARQYLSLFNNLSENVLLSIAFSCSKTLTAYGLRLGACIIANKNKLLIDELYLELIKQARSIWSNVPLGAMELFTKVTNQNFINNYLKEKQLYIDLLEERAKAFKKGSKDYNIPLYPHVGGFFITIMVDNKDKEELYLNLKKENVFLLKVNKGIRVGLCGLSVKKCLELPSLIAKHIKHP